jgi:hypothetical protein
VTLGLPARRQKMVTLNDGRIHTPTAYAKQPLGYRRVEGNRRASRNGRVGDIPHPKSLSSRFAALSCTAMQKLRIVILARVWHLVIENGY